MELLVIVLYLVTLGVLAVYGVHRTALLWAYLRHRHERTTPIGRFSEETLPRVTVQLPMFNEPLVASRLIQAAAKLDYPSERLEIQVLDDSNDETVELARALCDRIQHAGVDIRYVRRPGREGFKAGALAYGLARAKGELILVFDADFVPAPSAVRDLVDFFSDPTVGMVQARWGHLNRAHSLITQCQAQLLDGHFVIEHAARNRSGRFFNFNGTAGMWRRSAIEDAGGWQHDTITEDMDLSYRAQLAGWSFVYLPDVSVPAELPGDMNSFKSQQYRWAKGSVQTARKLLGRIARANVPLRVKQEAFFHLTNNVAYVFLLVLAALQLPNMLIRRQMEDPTLLLLDVPLFWATCGSVAAFYVVAHRALYRSTWAAVRRLPAMMALGIGLAVNNGRAAIEGFFGGDVEFVRTPKTGTTDTERRTVLVTPRARTLWPVAVELVFGMYCGLTLIVAIATQSWASVPFVTLFAVGFLYVGIASAVEAWRAAHAQGVDSSGAHAPSTHSSPSPQSMLS